MSCAEKTELDAMYENILESRNPELAQETTSGTHG